MTTTTTTTTTTTKRGGLGAVEKIHATEAKALAAVVSAAGSLWLPTSQSLRSTPAPYWRCFHFHYYDHCRYRCRCRRSVAESRRERSPASRASVPATGATSFHEL